MCFCFRLNKICVNQHSTKKGWRIFKNLDAFGHPVRLNFDQKGNTHRTLCGALVTVLFVVIAIAIILGFSVLQFNKDTIDVSQGLVSKQVIATAGVDKIEPTWLVFYATNQQRQKVKIDSKQLQLTLNGNELKRCTDADVRGQSALLPAGGEFFCSALHPLAFTRQFNFQVKQICSNCEDYLREFNFHLATLDYSFNGVLVENKYKEPPMEMPANKTANATMVANMTNSSNATRAFNATNATLIANATQAKVVDDDGDELDADDEDDPTNDAESQFMTVMGI